MDISEWMGRDTNDALAVTITMLLKMRQTVTDSDRQ